eukprot:CAMPEP_0175166542 /NCGR_PEP_ID=MMETSP0087-20121206/27766_1 /TAXON_ID=136419 /ORGANISM="Unknown Unknown, Strain D1" /LENGTH=78 /DNA_ID=CAMNT_0016456175 /DNA_START=62 /DNA_END=295 /DNA_ORIENTATION=-
MGPTQSPFTLNTATNFKQQEQSSKQQQQQQAMSTQLTSNSCSNSDTGGSCSKSRSNAQNVSSASRQLFLEEGAASGSG